MNDHLLSNGNQSSDSEGVWHMDITKLDIKVAFKMASGEIIYKLPWLILGVDEVGFIQYIRVSGEPLELQEKESGNNGPSQLWYDNGDQFQKVHFDDRNPSRVIHSLPNRPQGRGKVERIFRNLNQALPVLELPPKNRAVPLTLEELRTALNTFIRQYNANRTRSDNNAN